MRYKVSHCTWTGLQCGIFILEVMKMTKNTKRLTESAMLIAVAVVLELVSKMFIPGLPFGGQFTLASMLPVVLISYRHGMKWGFCASFAYALIEMAIGTKNVAAAFQPDRKCAHGQGIHPSGPQTHPSP